MLKSFINQKLILGSILIALILVGSILIIHPILVNAAETTGYEWGHTFGTTDVVGGEEADDYVYDIATDPTGNVYSVGYFSAETAIDLDATAGTDTYSNGGAFITQYSYDGSYMLGKVFENHSDTVDSVMKMYQIEVDLEENIYLYGEFKGTFDFDMGAGTVNYTSSNSGADYNFFIAKYDSSMNYLWVRVVRTTGTSLAQYSQMKTDLQNNVYVCGSFYGTSIDFNGTSGIDMEYSEGGSDAHLTKYFADGSYGWTTRIGGSGEDTCDALALLDDQSILVAGTFQGSSIDTDPSSFFTTNISAVGTTDTYVIRYVATDSSTYGLLTTPQSHFTIGASGATVIPDALDVDNNGNFYLGGTYEGGAVLGGPAPNNQDVFLAKYNINTTLDFDWARFFTSTGNNDSLDDFHALDAAPNGNIYMATSFYDDVDMNDAVGDDVITLETGVKNDLITKYGTDGSYKWTNIIDNGLGTTNGLVYNNENLYLGGTFQGAIDLDFTTGTDSGTVYEDLDAFIIRNTDADAVSIQNLDSSLTATDTYRDIDATSASRYLYGLRRPIRIADSGNNSPIGEIYTNMYTSHDWTGVSGDSDPTANKVLVDGLNAADGTETKFTLYVPRESGDDRIYICPDASLLSEVSSSCAKRYTLFETDENVSTTTINTQDYWAIENYSNTGAMSASGDTLSHPTTGAYYNQTYTFGNDTTTGYSTQETRLADSVTDSNGNLYIVGYFNDDTGVDFDGTSGTDIHTNTSSTGYDMYITKYNQDGSYAWTETIQTTDTGSIFPIAVDISSTDVLYIAGEWKSVNLDFDPGAGTDVYTSTDFHATDYIGFVSKFNADGTYISTSNWTEEMDFLDIKVDSSGNYYVAGEFSATTDPIDLDPTAGTDMHSAYYDTTLVKINSDDSYAWGRSFGNGAEVARPASITVDGDDNIYLGGLFGTTATSQIANFDDTGGTDEFRNPDRDFNDDFRDGYLTKYNADGSYGWTSVIPNLGVSYTVLDDVFIRDLKWDTETNTIHILGNFESEYIGFEYNGEYTTLYNSASESNQEAFWAQYSTDGEVLTVRKIDNSAPEDEYLYEIIPNDNGDTYILGKLQPNTTVDLDLTSGTDTYGPTGTSSYMFVSKYTDGEYDWTKYVESANAYYFKPINLLKYQNDIHILGTYADTDLNFDLSGGTDLHSTAGGEDVFYLKFQDVGPISIQNLDSNLQATDQDTGEDATTPSTNFYGPSRSIRIQDVENLVLADVTVDLTADRDWTSVTGDVDLTAKKSVINNLVTAPGTAATHTLYVPKATSDTAVYLCPDATILSEVSVQCTNRTTLTEADSNTSVTTINSQDYWMITGVSGTGGISNSPPEPYPLVSTNFENMYAGREAIIVGDYIDNDGATDLDKMYLIIENNSGTNIEYYAEEGVDGTGFTPTAVSGSEYVQSITYDRDFQNPDANTIRITWHITLDWDWEEDILSLGAKTSDDAGNEEIYTYILYLTGEEPLYENDLDFDGTLTATSSALGSLTTSDWVPGNDTITWSGVKVVYEGTTDVYPSDSDFDITLTDDDTGSWSDTISSGENISIVSTADSATDTEDIHTLAITGIPTGGSAASSLNFTLKVDASTPDIVDVTGANEGVWQATDSGPVISWTDPTSPSDDTFYITNDGSEPTSSNYQYTTSNPTYDLPDQGDGETSIKVRALNSAGTYSTSQEFLVRYYTNYVPDNSTFTISGHEDIYAGKSQTIITTYSDVNSASNLDNLYLNIQNPSGTDIEYYADEGTDGTGLTPTAVTGNEYVTSITYDRDTGAPDANSITITWNITYDWDWAESTNIEFGMKATDDASGDSGYTYTDNNYLYENDLDFDGTLTATSSALGSLTTGDWVPGNDTITWSGVTAVYEGTTDVYPPDGSIGAHVQNDIGDTFVTPDPNLVGYWRMDETSWNGTSGEVIDSSSYTNNGTASGATISPSSKYQNAASFDGNDSITIPSNSSLDMGAGSFTISLWAWVDNSVTYNTERILVEYGTWETGTYQLTSFNDMYVAVNFNGYTLSGDQRHCETDWTDSTWHHIVGVLNDQENYLAVYMDGSLCNIIAENNTPASRILPLYIGSRGGYEKFFAGRLDDVRVYNKALSANEIETLFYETEPIADDIVGSEINITSTAKQITDTEDIHTLSITSIPTGGSAVQDLNFTIRVDASTPDIVDVTGDNENTAQSVDSGPVISWTDPTSPSDDTFYITNDGSEPTSSNYQYTTTSPTYDLPDQGEGTTTIKVRALNGAGTYSTVRDFIIIYEAAPDIVDITGNNEDVWQASDSGPVISWTDPNSYSDDTFYITIDGSDPTSSNYEYTTTNPTYDLPDQGEGTTTIKVRAITGYGLESTILSFIIKYDSSTADIVDITGANEGVWQKTDSGPVISWTDPNSISGDTFYITNDGSTPSSSNYQYTTTLNSYNLPDQGNGETTVKVVAINAVTTGPVYSFIIRYDGTTPDIVDVTGADDGVWQATDSGPIISWTDPNSPSDDTFYITNDGSLPTNSNYQYTTTNPTYDLPDQGAGETTIRVRALNGVDTYGPTYDFLIRYDSSLPDILDITGSYEDTWQTVDAGPIISWTDPNSASDDTFYITLDGSEPSATNYDYSTTNTTFDIPDQAPGETTIKVRPRAGIGTYGPSRSFILKYDPSTPSLGDITGTGENTWQNDDSGPVISWTDPNSPSGDTFYITTDGTEPTNSNYDYTTTSNSYDLPDQGEGTTTVKVRGLNGAGTYSPTLDFIIKYDETAPTNATNFNIEVLGTSELKLTWTNPGTDFLKVRILRKTTGIPGSTSDGTVVYEGSAESYTDSSLSDNTKYYYTIFALDEAGNAASGISNSKTTLEDTTPDTDTDSGDTDTQTPTPNTGDSTPTYNPPTSTVEEPDLSDELEDQAEDSPVIEPEPEKPIAIIKNNNQETEIYTDTKLHLYAGDEIEIHVPRYTLEDEDKSITQTLLVIDNETYILAYDETLDSYITKITIESPEGAHTAQIIAIYDDGSTRTLGMNYEIDPYGYVFVMEDGAEQRIKGAQVELWQRQPNASIDLWDTNTAQYPNPQTTDQKGEYKFYVEAGTYQLRVSADGYEDYDSDWFEVENNTIEKNIELEKITNYWWYGLLLLLILVIIGIIYYYTKKDKETNAGTVEKPVRTNYF